MPASPLIQLISVGQIDDYFSTNPQISYFKYAYKRHTRFAMESLKITFDGTEPTFKSSDNDSYRLKVPRHGDLLLDMNLVFKFPNVYSDSNFRFRWVENAGVLFIKKAELFLGGYARAIDTLYGEWLTIWNELTMSSARQNSHSNLVGNVAELTNPFLKQKTIQYINNRVSYTYYPESDLNSETPSIESRKVSIPLPFYFTKNPALALPLCALQTNEIILRIETENVENLYTIYDDILDKHISSAYYNQRHNTNISINTFVKETTISIEPYAECKYAYLDNDERAMISLNKRNNEFLIENIYRKNTEIVDGSSTIELNLSTPVKEIIWTTRRRDYRNYNSVTNYTLEVPNNNNKSILKTAKILWNRSNERVEEKEAFYYNKIIPYQHHTNVPKQGIYCYSFALNPEKTQPSGYFNPSGKYPISTNVYITCDTESNLEFEITFWVISYNILHLIGGQGSLKFA